jgi:hypothetical protein
MVDERWTDKVWAVEQELSKEKVESDQAVRMPPEAPLEGLAQKQLSRRGRKEASLCCGI